MDAARVSKRRHFCIAGAGANGAAQSDKSNSPERSPFVSMLKDLITNFLEEMADFANNRESGQGARRHKSAPVRLYSRAESEAISRRENEGGRGRRRRDTFEFLGD